MVEPGEFFLREMHAYCLLSLFTFDSMWLNVGIFLERDDAYCLLSLVSAFQRHYANLSPHPSLCNWPLGTFACETRFAFCTFDIIYLNFNIIIYFWLTFFPKQFMVHYECKAAQNIVRLSALRLFAGFQVRKVIT